MDWLKRYHPNPEPDQLMFVCLRGKGFGGRLGGSGVYKLIRRLGKEAGLDAPVRPHGIRHSAVTSALDLRDGDVRAVRHFSSHANLDVLLVYNDARQDFAGEISKEVDAELWGCDSMSRLPASTSPKGPQTMISDPPDDVREYLVCWEGLTSNPDRLGECFEQWRKSLVATHRDNVNFNPSEFGAWLKEQGWKVEGDKAPIWHYSLLYEQGRALLRYYDNA